MCDGDVRDGGGVDDVGFIGWVVCVRMLDEVVWMCGARGGGGGGCR